MFKKLILSTVIGLTLQVNAENSAQNLREAKQPTVTESSHATMNQLVLNAGVFDPLSESLDFSKSGVSNIQSKKYRIIQFENGHADSTWLRNNGFKVVSYLANNAFIVVNNPNAQKDLANNKNIRWHGKYQSAFKVSPELWQKNLKRQESYEIFLAIFKDFSKEHYQLLLRKFVPEAHVKYIYTDDSNGMVITLKNSQIDKALEKLAKIEEVQYIELVHPMKFNNAEATAAVQSNQDSGGLPTNDTYVPEETSIFDHGLFGTGQIVGVADSGLDSNEDWFAHYNNGTTVSDAVTEAENTTPPAIGTLHPNNKVIGYFVMPGAVAYDHSGLGFHGTHVNGSVAGDRKLAIGSGPAGSVSSPTSSGYDNDDGMAPNAQLLFQDIGSNDGLSGQGSSPMWEQAHAAGARIHSNSYGSDTNGQYSFSDLFADKSLRQFEDMLILFAAGNDGADENSVGSPANGKSVTTVGALAHGNSPFFAQFSNSGPTDDGRMKPDIMATGARIESASGNSVNTTTITPPVRKQLSGTSMATPITAGASALMRQFYTDGFYPTGVKTAADSKIPSGALMKATLINGAGIDGGHYNKDIGWGRVFLSNSIMFDDSEKQMHVWEVLNANGLKTGESMSFKLAVKDDMPLAITLAWYDVPGPFGSSKTLINDIDLEVKVNGQVYKGNVFNGTASSGTGGDFDHINTVEQVRLPTPTQGVYTITIKGFNIPGDEEVNSFRQGFGLIATGHLADLSTPAGGLTAISAITADMQGDNGIKLAWDGGDNADFYEIYKMQGSCASADFKQARLAGTSENNEFTDFRTLNGLQYAYKIRAGQYGELGELSSACVEVTSNQACDFLPAFSQSSIHVVNNVNETCQTKLQWSAATASCPGNSIAKYNIYRSDENDFTPNAANLLTTVTGTSYDDIRAPGTASYYVVRAVDNAGNETAGTSKVRSQPIAPGFTPSPTLEDVDNVAIMNLSFPWQVASSKAADGVLSYKTGDSNGNYPADTCAAIVTNTIPLTADITNLTLSYKAFYDLEEKWDGVVVEISTDDGATWTDLPPVGGYPSDFSLSDDGNGGVVNACGYAKTHGAFSATNGSFQTITHDLSAFAGQNVKVRWQLSSDPASEFEGFYIDSINYPNVELPNVCTVNTSPIGPAPGLYADANHNGHGFVLEPLGNDLYFTVFYTYHDDGTADWFTHLATLENGQLTDTLNAFTYDYSVDPTGSNTPLVADTSVTRTLSLDFNDSAVTAANCSANSTGVANWSIGSDSGQWCVKPVVSAENFPSQDFGGTWWTGSDDDGWGLSLTFAGDLAIATVYYFDANGNPRWVQGTQSGFQASQNIVINMKDITGYGRSDTPADLVFTDAGTLTLNLSNTNGNASDGVMSIDVTYQGSEGGTWSRTNMALQLLSQPHQ